MSILYNSTSSKIILAVTILALVIQLAISQVIAGSITSALASMRAVCEKLRDGDFRSGDHALDRGDEFGHLSGTLMQMQEKMASYMKGIYGTVQNINSAAANLKEASMQSAQAAIQSAEAVGESAHLVTDQESALNDSSSLLEKVNTSIQEMRSHAEEVSANSKQAANEADHGQGVLEKTALMDNAIRVVSQDAQDISASVADINAKGQVISQHMESLSAATEQQSASSEEIASASETLSNMAHEQQQALRQFKF